MLICGQLSGAISVCPNITPYHSTCCLTIPPATKLQIGVNAAIASCTLCIAKRMELIASDRGLGMSRRGQHLVELSLCLGLPLVLMGLRKSTVTMEYLFTIIDCFFCFRLRCATRSL